MCECKRCKSPMNFVEETIEDGQVCRLWQCDCGQESKSFHNIQKNETHVEWL